MSTSTFRAIRKRSPATRPDRLKRGMADHDPGWRNNRVAPGISGPVGLECARMVPHGHVWAIEKNAGGATAILRCIPPRRAAGESDRSSKLCASFSGMLSTVLIGNSSTFVRDDWPTVDA